MELWIRSQNKTRLTKINAISVLTFDGYVTIHGYITNDDHLWLGNYKTKERAFEILDEIQKLLTMQRISIPAHNCNDTKHIYKDELINYVYEMPKE